MKKTFKTLTLMLLAALAFSSCADVPEPYNLPGSKSEDNGQTIIVEPEGDGTQASPYNVAAAVAMIKEMEAGVESTQEYYIKGKVLTVTTTAETIAQYGNHTFTMADEGNSSNVFTAFQVYGPGKQKFTSVDAIKVGDEVVVCGKVVNYKGNTPETVGKGQAYVVSINSNGDNGGETEKAEHITIAEFLAKADPNTTYELTGKVSGIKNTTYGNFDLVEDGASVYIYGLLDFNGNSRNFASLGIAEGDEITITGKYKDYNGTAEIADAQIVSINGRGGDTPGGETTGDGTKDSPYNVASAITKSGTAWVSGYIVGWVDGMTLATGANFNSASTSATNILIADSPSETNVSNCMPVQLPSGAVRTALNLQNNPSNYQKQVKLYGSIEKYFGAPGLKSVTDYVLDDQGNDEPQGDIQHITIAEFLAKADANTTYELTGKVSNIKNTTYGNFDLVEGDASIYIYGLLDLSGAAKNFASLGIVEGDEITVTGKYTLYNNTPEIANAQLVSIKKGDGGNNNNDDNGGETVDDLENGGFEIWLNDTEPMGWRSVTSASNATLAKSTDARSGSLACIVKAPGTQNKRLATQEMTLAKGKYNFSYYAKSTTADKSQTRGGFVDIKDDGSVGTYTYNSTYADLNNNGWTLVSYDFELTATTKLCLIVMNPKNSNYSVSQDILIDDATLTKK